MSLRRVATLGVLGVTLAAACGDDNPPAACVPGDIDDCVCPGGTTGYQECLDDYTYGGCICPSADAGRADAAENAPDAGTQTDGSAGTDGPAADGAPPAPDAGPDVTVQEIQAASMPVGTAVTVRGVVVVAVDAYGARTGGTYVVEPTGGPFSGILVAVSDGASAALSPGDLVDVLGGVKAEFTLEEPPCARTSDCALTMIEPPAGGSITFETVGSGSIPSIPIVNPWDLASDDQEAEKWESVPIQFANVRAFGAPHVVSATDSTLKDLAVTGPFVVNSALTELSDTIANGDCYFAITGVVDYFFDYKLLPRSAADLTGGGTSCLPEEEGDTACGDEADNDYDGFTDCADFSCHDTAASCTTSTTVVALQSDTVAANTHVALSDVIVTAIDKDREHLWVQDQGGAAHHNGIYVHRGSSPAALDSPIQIGELVSVVGYFQYYAGMTEVGSAEVTFVSGGPVNVAVLTDANTDTLGDPSTGTEWEGTVVRFTNVPVIDPDAGLGQATIGSAGSPLYMDDDCYPFDVSSISCLAEVTGVVHMNTFDSHYSILPRSAADLAGGGTCN